MTEREWEDEGAGGEPAEAGVRWEAAGCFWAVWGFGWDVGVAIFGGLGFGCSYEVRKAWSERVRSNILAERYEVDVPEAQQGRKRFDNYRDLVERSVSRRLYKLPLRGTRDFFFSAIQ